MAGFASVVEDVASGQDFCRFGFQKFQSLIERADRDTADTNGIELLESGEVAGLRAVADRCDRAQGDEFVAGATDLHVEDLIFIESAGAVDLRDDLVAAALDIEAVHKISTYASGQVAANFGEVQAESRDFVAVNDKL